ncbi:MAG: cytochrome c3 family protein [Myxococcaceae bacterium]
MNDPVGKIARALLLALVAGGCNVAVGTQQGYEPSQPVAFSHALHSGEYKIDCLYCHAGAEQSRHAGVPPVQVCMNCHTQVKKDAPEVQKLFAAMDGGTPIAWTRVHRLPDYAYLSHASHVGAGVKCQQCHGPVETMVRVQQLETMAMGWCLDCHRTTAAAPVNPQKLAPPTDCSACHR